MSILDRKSRLERALDSVDVQEILKAMARSAAETAVSGVHAATPDGQDGVKTVLGEARHQGRRVVGSMRKVSKPGLAAAGAAAGVTVVSAVVSSARRRGEREGAQR